MAARKKTTRKRRTAEEKEIDEQKLIESFDGKLLNGQEKGEFRKTKKWKDFRRKFYIKETKTLKNGKKRDIPNVDALTLKPLSRTFNLHHMCLDPRQYTNLKNEFIPLNSQSHEFLHWAYTQYCRDPEILDRLIALVKEMYDINNGKDVKNYN